MCNGSWCRDPLSTFEIVCGFGVIGSVRSVFIFYIKKVPQRGPAFVRWKCPAGWSTVSCLNGINVTNESWSSREYLAVKRNGCSLACMSWSRLSWISPMYLWCTHAYISCSSFDFGTVGWLGVVKAKDVLPGSINRSNNTIQALWWNFSMCKTHPLHVQQHAKHMFCAMVDLTTHTASCDSAFYGEQTICASTSEKIKLVTTWQNWCITEKYVAYLPFCRPNPPATKPLSEYSSWSLVHTT